MKKIFLVLMVLTLFSCKKEDVTINEESRLIGKWDSYNSMWESQTVGTNIPAYSVLFNYEQGFEIFANKTYHSRYTVTQNTLNPGTWSATADSITFKHIALDGSTEALVFALVKIETNKLIIKRRDGLSFYLKRAL